MFVNFKSVRGVLGFYTLLLVAGMIVSPVLIGIYNLKESRNEIERNLNQALEMQAFFLGKWFALHQQNVRSIASLPSIQAFDYDGIFQDLQNIARSDPNFDSLVYVDNRGVPIVRSSSGVNTAPELSVTDRPYFQDALRGKEHISEVLIGRSSGKPIIIFSYPLMNGDEFNGLLFGSVTFTTIINEVNRTTYGKTGHFLLLTEKGSTIINGHQNILSKNTFSLQSLDDRKLLDDGKLLEYQDSSSGQRFLTVTKHLPGLHLMLVARMEYWEFIAPFIIELFYVLITTAVLLGGALFISKKLYGRVNKSLSALMEAVGHLGEGRFIPISSHGLMDAPEEIEGLAKAFNLMVETIKKNTEELKFRSFHDELTELYNRSFFEDSLARFGSRRFDPLTVAICDVDGLKLLNDALGHKAGDALLIAAANVLRKCARKSDIVARIGGDEFALLLPQSTEDMENIFFEALKKNLAEYRNTPNALPLHIACGTATGSIDQWTMESLVQEADKKMYAFKQVHKASSREDILGYLSSRIEVIRKDSRDRHMVACAALMDVFTASRPDFSTEKRDFLVRLARNHDLGFTEIPLEIFDKPEPLTPEEYELVKRHSETGARLVSLFPELADLRESILLHHRWWNGKGYPEGEGGEAIPEASRIMAVVDAYEAMTGDRIYRAPKSPCEAVEELRRCAGTQFDPFWAEEFSKFILNFHETIEFHKNEKNSG